MIDQLIKECDETLLLLKHGQGANSPEHAGGGRGGSSSGGAGKGRR